jgi:hypothetical protein
MTFIDCSEVVDCNHASTIYLSAKTTTANLTFKGILKLILDFFCISWKLAIGSINDIYETLTQF